NYGTAAVWFGAIISAVVAAGALWEFWATLDTEFLLIGASGLSGAAFSIMAGEILHANAAAVTILNRRPGPEIGARGAEAS
ncbi:MAG TPA: hypothetical protein VGB18_02790, partial [Candidatus Thermoplasmatota archaeon]